jgi:hypothetical protein
MSVGRCQEEVDSEEFVEWLAYRRISQWGPERADWHAAMIGYTIATAMGGSKSVKFSNFFFPTDSKPSGQDPQEQRMRLNMWATMMNRSADKKEVQP